MSAGPVNLTLDVGADAAFQIYWTDAADQPLPILNPIRMQVRNSVGGVVATLQTTDTSEDADAAIEPSILYNTESGLVQLFFSAEQTSEMGPGQFSYDLYVSYADNYLTGKVRTKKLIEGQVFVNGRVTR